MKLLRTILLATFLLVFTPKQVFAETSPYTLCSQIPKSEARDKCLQCEGGTSQVKGVWTAIGCIETNQQTIVKKVMNLGLTFAGALTLVLLLSSSFLFSVSRGEPKKVSDAKEMLTNTIIGLLLIIFSVTILQFIGQSVFQIPGL